MATIINNNMSASLDSIKELADGRYQKSQLLGKGAFGKLYKAYDTILKKEVALKIVTRLPGTQNTQGLTTAVRITHI